MILTLFAQSRAKFEQARCGLVWSFPGAKEAGPSEGLPTRASNKRGSHHNPESYIELCLKQNVPSLQPYTWRSSN